MKAIKGDLITLAEEGLFDVIVHGCNCFNTMGAGIAKQIKQRYPAAYEADCTTKKGDVKKLGSFTSVNTGKFTIVNAYTQYRYGKGRLVDYDAIWSVFGLIAHIWPNKRIGYPCIGAGHAGGKWAIIKPIIDQQLKGMDHTVVKFQR